MRKVTISIILLLVLSGCTTYYHHFDLLDQKSKKIGDYILKASVEPSGHRENTEKHMKQRIFDISFALSISLGDSQSQEVVRRTLDRYLNVDKVLVSFDNDNILRSLAVIEITMIGGVDFRNDLSRNILRKGYIGKEFIIPDSIKTVRLTVPFYSKTPDGIV